MPKLIVTDSTYQFVPPHEGSIWPRFLSHLVPTVLRRKFGITEVELRGTEKLTPLLEAGDGVLLAPNHCRMSDPLLLQCITQKLGQPLFTMASSHLFRDSRFLKFLLQHGGCFSVYREGFDRKALQKAVDILTKAQRPLLVFPEGSLSQANDRLNALMDGVAFMARSAAKNRERQGQGGKVFVVPVALRYLFQGDLTETASPILSSLERRLTWRVREDLSVLERTFRIGPALLTLKEIEHFGVPQTGSVEARLLGLIDQLLTPLETEWLEGARDESVVARVKALRKAVMPDMIEDTLDAKEIDRRWRQLEDMELAQKLSLYPREYVASKPTADRILETVRRFEDHLSDDDDESRICPPEKAILEIGTPIEVSSKRDRSATQDPVMAELEHSLNTMLEKLSEECATESQYGARGL